MKVVVNAAMSADGKLSTVERDQIRISGPDDFRRVDKLRADVDAVMVGVGTVLADDPSLTIKDAHLRNERTSSGRTANPVRVVADSRARTPIDAELLGDDAPTHILVAECAPDNRVATLDSRATVHVVGDTRVDLTAGLTKLATNGIDELLVEGGGELIFSLFADGLVDRLSVYIGNQVIGGRDAPTLADGEGFADETQFPRLSLDAVEAVDDGLFITWNVLDV